MKSDNASIKKLCCDIKSLVTSINPIKASVNALLDLSQNNVKTLPPKNSTTTSTVQPSDENSSAKSTADQTTPKMHGTTPVVPKATLPPASPATLSSNTGPSASANMHNTNHKDPGLNPWITVRRQHKRDSTPKILPSTEYVAISDSMMRDVIEEKLDSQRRIQIKTFGGKTTSTLAKEIDKFPKCPKVKHAHLHAGFNDCTSLNPMTRTSIALLISSTEAKFPNAKITFSLVLPTKDGVSDSITKFNDVCRTVCFNKRVEVIDFGEHFQNGDFFNADTVHLNDAGTDLMEDLLYTLFLGQSKNSKEKDDRNKDTTSSNDKRNVTTDGVGEPIPVIGNGSTGTRVDSPQSQTHSSDSVPPRKSHILLHTQETKAPTSNIFQGFGAKCTSHEEARSIEDSIKKEYPWTANTPWTANATSLMKAYCVMENGRQTYRIYDDGERGAAVRMKKLMEAIGMNDCFVIVARQYGGKIESLRWTILQNQLFDIATQLGYSIPPGINVHTILPPPHQSKETPRINPTPRPTRGQQYQNTYKPTPNSKPDKSPRSYTSGYQENSRSIPSLLKMKMTHNHQAKTQHPAFPYPAMYNEYDNPMYNQYAPTPPKNTSPQNVHSLYGWSHDYASPHAQLYHSNGNDPYNWWNWYRNT